MSGGDKLRIAFVGWGAIARRAAELLVSRGSNVAVVGVGTRRAPLSDRGLPPGASWLPSSNALRDIAPDIVIEAAGREAVEPWGKAAIQLGSTFIVCSTSAFTDDALLQRMIAEAERSKGRILLPSGALGGLDALAAAGCLMLDSVVHRIVKPPIAWRGTLAEELVDLGKMKTAQVFFTSTARDVAARFPANANVAVISALAGLGLDRTEVQLVADPAIVRNCHHLEARGDFGVLKVIIENQPLAANPKSSELTALSLVRVIESRCRPISI